MFQWVSIGNWSLLGDVEGTWEMQEIEKMVSYKVVMFIGVPLEGRGVLG